MMEYKGYIGLVQFDPDAGIFHGEVINTRDVITFQGESVEKLRRAFRASVDDYLAFCAKRGEQPEKPYSGQFITRVAPAVHRLISIAASSAGKSLNAWVCEQLQKAVAEIESVCRIFPTNAQGAAEQSSQRHARPSSRAKRRMAKQTQRPRQGQTARQPAPVEDEAQQLA
jgi:predicted HicB family RNase H-like nuclease